MPQLVYCATGKKSLLNDRKEKKRNWNLKEKAIYRPLYGTYVGKD